MFKKLFLLLTALLLSAASITPASAASTLSSVGSAPSSLWNGNLVALSDSQAIAVWVEGDDDYNRYVKSGILQADGTFTSIQTVASYIKKESSYVGVENVSAVKLADGTVAAAWVTSTTNNDSSSSDVSIAYTADGLDWSGVIQVFETRTIVDGGFGCMMMVDCGYNNVKIAGDSRGVIAMAVAYGTSYNTEVLLTKSSRDGTSWSATTNLSNSHNTYYSSLTALPGGGFMSLWSSYVNGGSVPKYSMMPAGLLNFWTSTKTLATAVENINAPTAFAQTSPNELSAFFQTNSDSQSQIVRKIFDLNARVWGSDSTVLALDNGFWFGDMVVSVGKNFHTALSVGYAINGELKGSVHLVDIVGSVASPAIKISETESRQGRSVTAIKANSDDSITVLVNRGDAAPQFLNIKNGLTLSTVDVAGISVPSRGQKTAISANGNFFVASDHSAGTMDTFAYITASKPMATGAALLRGTAKVGKSLTAAIPTFAGITGAGTTSIQWYACKTAVAVATDTVPANCVAIAKATASSMKLTSKHKGKFLTVVVKNTNAVGTTTLVAKSTAKSQ